MYVVEILAEYIHQKRARSFVACPFVEVIGESVVAL